MCAVSSDHHQTTGGYPVNKLNENARENWSKVTFVDKYIFPMLLFVEI